jgi:hypothetical protein
MKTKLPLFFVFVLITSPQISAQDVIFKRNGDVVNAKNLNQSRTSISYKYSDNRDSLTYYISVAAIDSIYYQNGTRDTFPKENTENRVSVQPMNPVYRHHLVGVDLADILLFSRVGVSYEYLPGKMNFGFKLAFEKNFNLLYYENQTFSPYPGFTNWGLQIGVDYYFFPPRTFRFGGGLHYVFRQEMQYDYSNYTSTTYIKNVGGLMLSLFSFYNMTKDLAINFGFKMPFYSNSVNISWIQCEIMYNF